VESRDPVLISKCLRVDYQILRSSVPVSGWATWRILGVEGWLKEKERQAGWDRFVWSTLLALHGNHLVCRLEQSILLSWYGWGRFNPQEAARRLGGLIPRCLRDRLSATQAQFDTSVRRMLPLALLFAFTGLTGLAADLSFYVLVLLRHILLQASVLSPSQARVMVVIGVRFYMWGALACLIATVVYYGHWLFDVLTGWWEYHQVVLETKNLLKMTGR